MNRILEEVAQHMHEALSKALPRVKASKLEKGGAVFYMNGKNGTAFDWYVNEHLPSFFIFYNDRENLGAVRADLHTNGNLTVYVYGKRGHAEPERFEMEVDATAEELLELAALLTYNADQRLVWDEDIIVLDSDGKPSAETFAAFISLREDHLPMIDRKALMAKTVIVSRKVREGGWKIGYGMREEPTRDSDSGWYFCVGDEADEYVNDPQNLELWLVSSALMYDPALEKFIDAPYGTAIVRTAPGQFEPDAPGKEIYFEPANRR